MKTWNFVQAHDTGNFLRLPEGLTISNWNPQQETSEKHDENLNELILKAMNRETLSPQDLRELTNLTVRQVELIMLILEKEKKDE